MYTKEDVNVYTKDTGCQFVYKRDVLFSTSVHVLKDVNVYTKEDVNVYTKDTRCQFVYKSDFLCACALLPMPISPPIIINSTHLIIKFV